MTVTIEIGNRQSPRGGFEDYARGGFEPGRGTAVSGVCGSKSEGADKGEQEGFTEESQGL